MRRFPISLLFLLLFSVGSGGCTKDGQRLADERQRRIRAESWIRRAESALNSCKRHISQLQRQSQQWRYRCGRSSGTRIASLQRQLTQVRNQLNARNRHIQTLSQQIYRLQQQIRAMQANVTGRGVLAVLGVRRYRGRLSPALRRQLTAVPPKLINCYRRLVLTRNVTQREIFWVILATSRYGVTDVDVGIQGRPRPTTPPHFRRCVAQVLRGQRAWKTPTSARFALLLAFAPTPNDLKTLRRPTFSWPWKPLRGRTAGQGQICRLGRRALRGSGRLNPHLARPCAPGLKCCYPCGIQGCNSVCMKDCGPPRP